MYAVFYDLETSDRLAIGQILNYSFILVDEEHTILDELSGIVRISRLQLPDPEAILANRVNVREHQAQAVDEEPQALARIVNFIHSCVQRGSGSIALIGYNSSKFDLQYLRTSLIRNGLDPLFGRSVVPHDLLHLVQKAYLVSEQFRQRIRAQRAGEKKLSLALETVAHALNLLEGAQAHESRADVVVTIEVARWLRSECGLDVRSYEPYEAIRLHPTARSGAVYLQEAPEYDLAAADYRVRTPMTLLDTDGRSALWIDLDRYAAHPDPRCIQWRSATKHAFFTNGAAVADPDLQRCARAALKQFQGTTLKNFFKATTCDIELDVYRPDFAARDLLNKAIATGDKGVFKDLPEPKKRDLRALWVRYQLARPELDLTNPKSRETLRQYAEYRYGGHLQVARVVAEEGGDAGRRGEAGASGKGEHSKQEYSKQEYSSTLQDQMLSLRRLKDASLAQQRGDDFQLLEALEEFYLGSDIVRVAGHQLLPHLVAAEGN